MVKKYCLSGFPVGVPVPNPWQKDYVTMQAMIFDSPPPWSQIIETLSKLENEINALD